MTPPGAAGRLGQRAARILLSALMSAAVTVLERRLRRAFDRQRCTDAGSAAESAGGALSP
jgi:hypothetical protein